MSYRIEITRAEIMNGEDVAVEVEAIDPGAATVAMKVATHVDDWTALSNAVTQTLLLMQLKVPK